MTSTLAKLAKKNKEPDEAFRTEIIDRLETLRSNYTLLFMELFAELLRVTHDSVEEVTNRVLVIIGSSQLYARLEKCEAWPRSTEADLLIPLRVGHHLTCRHEVRVRSTDGDILLALASRFPAAPLLFVTSMTKARSITTSSPARASR
mmetsp:Transcript_42906/g.108321  ORF Transcript_42906/g.108321 Transcript_42906/m.108321 type:complete len:148 (+) Transcript_42906:82-525(+)